MNVAEHIARIRAKLAAVDPANTAARKCPKGIVVLELSDGLSYTIDLEALTMCEGGPAEGIDADATFSMDDATFVALGNKELDLEAAKTDGRVRVAGDAQLLAALRECDKEGEE